MGIENNMIHPKHSFKHDPNMMKRYYIIVGVHTGKYPMFIPYPCKWFTNGHLDAGFSSNRPGSWRKRMMLGLWDLHRHSRHILNHVSHTHPLCYVHITVCTVYPDYVIWTILHYIYLLVHYITRNLLLYCFYPLFLVLPSRDIWCCLCILKYVYTFVYSIPIIYWLCTYFFVSPNRWPKISLLLGIGPIIDGQPSPPRNRSDTWNDIASPSARWTIAQPTRCWTMCPPGACIRRRRLSQGLYIVLLAIDWKC